jgi:uncharacterized membrane protein
MAEESFGVDKLVSLIPEIYYDLIGRIVPGSILCFVVSWLTEFSSQEELTAAVAVITLLVVSYAAGFRCGYSRGGFIGLA